MNDLLEQITNITKASAYDIISEQNKELRIENEKLLKRIEFLEKLIKEYSQKMLDNLNSLKPNP